jgi:hypothetical protein
MIAHKNLSDAQLNTHMRNIFTEGNPGGSIVGGCTSQTGHGFATGHHLETIACGQEILRRNYRKHECINKAAHEFLKEFVKDPYSAEIFSFLIGAYKGDDLTPEIMEELAQAFRSTTADYYP